MQIGECLSEEITGDSELVVGDNQWRQQADHVVVPAAWVDQQASTKSSIADVTCLPQGFFCGSIRHQFDPDHKPPATDLSDVRVIHQGVAQRIHEEST